MGSEWRTNPSNRRIAFGMGGLLLWILSGIAAIAAGVQSVPLWSAIVMSAIAGAGVFFILWGLEGFE